MFVNRVARSLAADPELAPALSALRSGEDVTLAVSQSARTLVLACRARACSW